MESAIINIKTYIDIYNKIICNDKIALDELIADSNMVIS